MEIRTPTKQVDEERALLCRCARGDREAWEDLIARYQRLIYSVAIRHSRDPHIVEDVFQEVCLELYRRLDDLRDPKALPAWLITVTRRKANRAIQRDPGWSDADPDRLATGDEAMASLERRFWLERALERLCDRCRALIGLLYLDPAQPSYAEVAERLGMPRDSVGPTRARCLEKLRKACGEGGD